MSEPQSASTTRRILIADDNPDAATSLSLLLELMGHTTHVVHDGIEAVEVAAEFQPDIILLDIGMPRLNGFEACGRIRAQPANKNIVIAALTGWTQDEKRQRSEEAGFDFYLIKPVEPDALQEVLRHPRLRGD